MELVVTLLYNGKKAQDVADVRQDGVRILFKDLLQLKLPFPKRENTTLVSVEAMGSYGYEFFWTSVKKFGTLHNSLISHITPTGVQSATYLRNLLEDLSITSLSFRERVSPEVNGRALKRKVSSIERETKPKFPNRQWIRPPDAPASAPMASQRVVSNSNFDEAQKLLDSVAGLMRPHKIPKLEPIEPSLADSPCGESIASSRPSPARVAVVPPQPMPISLQTTFNHNATSPMSISPSPPPPVPPSLLSSPAAQNRSHKPSPTPPGLTMHSRPRPLSPPRSRSGSSSQTRPTTPVRPRLPKPDDIPKIQKLTRELWDLRRQVTAGVARETTILNQLKDLNSPAIPESSTRLKSSDESVIKTRLQLVELELKEEKRRRMDAEASLKDIERECREPFVVPALLDAFITISKITSRAMDMDTEA